jgi:hypothetical protein
MGHYDPRGLLAATTAIGEADRAAILGGNALSLLGMNT